MCSHDSDSVAPVAGNRLPKRRCRTHRRALQPQGRDTVPLAAASSAHPAGTPAAATALPPAPSRCGGPADTPFRGSSPPSSRGRARSGRWRPARSHAARRAHAPWSTQRLWPGARAACGPGSRRRPARRPAGAAPHCTASRIACGAAWPHPQRPVLPCTEYLHPGREMQTNHGMKAKLPNPPTARTVDDVNYCLTLFPV